MPGPVRVEAFRQRALIGEKLEGWQVQNILDLAGQSAGK
jgi:hypothetical protein